MEFEEVLKIVKQSNEYQGYALYDLTDCNGNNILDSILKIVYDIAEQDGFNLGRISSKEEMNKYMEIQQKQMDLLESISQKLKANKL